MWIIQCMLDTIQFSFCKTNIWIKFKEPVNTHTVNKCWDSYYLFYLKMYKNNNFVVQNCLITQNISEKNTRWYKYIRMVTNFGYLKQIF